jgi:MFS family permease
VPLLGLSLFGGAIADTVDRRKLLLVTQVGLAGVSLALAVTSQAGAASVPLLYLLTAVGASFSALDNPTRASLAPTLVERRHIRAAMALNQTLFQLATVFGSVLAGVIIGRLGFAGAYWLDVASYAASFVAVWLMRTPPRVAAERLPVLRAVIEGIRYLGATRILLGTMAVDFLATFFASRSSSPSRSGVSRSPPSACSTSGCSRSRSCCSRSRTPRTSSARSSAARSCSSSCPTRSAGG